MRIRNNFIQAKKIKQLLLEKLENVITGASNNKISVEDKIKCKLNIKKKTKLTMLGQEYTAYHNL